MSMNGKRWKRALVVGLWFAVVVNVSGCKFNFGSKNGSKKLKLAQIASDSKTPECRKELDAVIRQFKKDLGLAFTVGVSDATSFFKTGKLRKAYARDGVQFTMTFGLTKEGGVCSVIMYERTRRQPGTFTSRTGNFGTAKLSKCRCK
jgi:hypothetical protein